MPNPKRPYPPDSAKRLRIYLDSGRSLKSVYTDLGISLEMPRTWVKRAQIDAGRRPGLTTEEHAELTRLRRC